MIKHLYFIGNGFDLHHNIQSKYTDYAYWLIDADLNLFYQIESVYGWPDKDWWGDFENSMGDFPIEEFSKEIYRRLAPDYGSEDFRERERFAAEYEAERILSNLYNDMRKSFSSWAAQLEPGDINRRIKLEIKDTYFITFNYTSTLETIYSLSNDTILHIHGKAGKDADLVLGHGKSTEQINNEVKNEMPKGLSYEQQMEWLDANESDFSYDRTLGATISAIDSQKKDVEGIIKKNEYVWQKITDLSDIYIMGFSFSPIDLPYIDKVLRINQLEQIQFHISYHVEEDKEKAQRFMDENQIPNHNVEFFKIEDLILKPL